METDALRYCAGEVKALGDGRAAGPLVTFGDESTPDRSEWRDYFDAETDYWLDFPAKVHTIREHWARGEYKGSKLGHADVAFRDWGIEWLKQFDLDRPDHADAYKAIQDGKLFLSSGSAGHLVHREAKANGVHRIASWPIVEASLTETPADLRNRVVALKSLADGAVAAPTLVDRSDRLVADATEFRALCAKALDQRRADGRDLSDAKWDAVKAARDALDALLAQRPPRVDRARLRALRLAALRLETQSL